ncbi:MAG: alpha/beta fold hydrolase [Nonomuraea sp.]|nr:alpha/beta fold hydrolase [Nonomuraea sp.]
MRIYARRFGSGGPAVVLLHGFHSTGERDWVDTGIVAALTALGRTVVVPDLPGHGSTPAFPARADVVARAVLELVEGPFGLAGYSLGARLAWEVVAQDPARVGNVVLGGLAPFEPLAGLDPAMFGPGLEEVVRGLQETPFTPDGWAGHSPPVFVAGEDDEMVRGIDGVAGSIEGAELVRVPGGHAEALAGPGFRETIVRVM